jgi:hypothetical protein
LSSSSESGAAYRGGPWIPLSPSRRALASPAMKRALSTGNFRSWWHTPPDHAFTSAESPVQNESCRRVREGALGNRPDVEPGTAPSAHFPTGDEAHRRPVWFHRPGRELVLLAGLLDAACGALPSSSETTTSRSPVRARDAQRAGPPHRRSPTRAPVMVRSCAPPLRGWNGRKPKNSAWRALSRGFLSFHFPSFGTLRPSTAHEDRFAWQHRAGFIATGVGASARFGRCVHHLPRDGGHRRL